MDTVRQQLVSAVISRLQEINTENTYLSEGEEINYQTNIGSVRDWETNFQEDELPAISVCDLSEPVEMDRGSINQLNNLKILLRIFQSSEDSAEFLRKAFGDIFASLGQDKRWKVGEVGLAVGTIINSSDILFKPDAFELGGGQVIITIIYTTKAFNAFT